MSTKKTTTHSNQDKQVSQLLKNVGITGKTRGVSKHEYQVVNELFPD